MGLRELEARSRRDRAPSRAGARAGRRRRRREAARARPTHGARAHRRARRRRLLPRARRASRASPRRTASGVLRPSRRRTSSSARRGSTGAPSSSAATTSRSAAAPTHPAGLRKGIYADELAIRRRVPLVRLLEGGGASIAGAGAVRGRSGYDLTHVVAAQRRSAMEALATVPVVCAALGPVAGFPAARLVASHFSLMTRETAQVLTGGPALVERAIGAQRDQGRARRRGRCTSRAASWTTSPRTRPTPSARSARSSPTCRRSVDALAPVAACDDPAVARRRGAALDHPARAAPRLQDPPRRRAGRRPRLVLRARRRSYGRSQVTGFARLAGRPVGVLANDCVHRRRLDDGRRRAQAAPLRRDLRPLPPADREPRRRAGLRDRPRRRARRDDPLRHGGDVRGARHRGAVVRGRAAARVRRRAGHPPRARRRR